MQTQTEKRDKEILTIKGLSNQIVEELLIKQVLKKYKDFIVYL